jgi:hypothetical protein
LRDFLDAILDFIDCASLSDEEWDSLTVTHEDYRLENYEALDLVLVSRETMSLSRDRLRFYFQAAGTAGVVEAPAGKSNILIGAAL